MLLCFRKRRLREKFSSTNTGITVQNTETKDAGNALDTLTELISRRDHMFWLHIENYIGKTVTVFVKSGGISGTGFTGVLMHVNEQYISLITTLCPIYQVGSIANIPIESIAALVHSNL